ncbi:GSCOCG00008369001-RA-CDS [Cotesia congregata]|nr:GSCOCG00008369001-RA-CDS [Cotesia congregata]
MKVRIILLTLVGFAVHGTTEGYPPQVIKSDGTAVDRISSEHEDSIAAASEVHDRDYDGSDDSDMYMEPDEAETENHESQQAKEEPAFNQASDTPETTTTESQVEADKIEAVPTAQEDKSLEQESQNFFPSFAELFANHRLTYNEQQQQQRYRPNRFLGYFQRERAPYQSSASTVKDAQHPLLGSGNFGVIRGGTYYSEEKDEEYNGDESLYNPYYSSNHANRGRSNHYRNPKPQPVRPGDFFSNFRDFADITAPPKSSFSHLSVVYTNRNGTKSAAVGGATEPRNIIETLRMLEEQDNENTGDDSTTTTELPVKKLSSGKRKLMKMKKYQEDKARKFRMTVEPLLALS